MALIVKIMSDEDLPDDDSRKSFTLHTGVASVEFHRRPGAPVAAMCFGDEIMAMEFPLVGNVYVMNETGKTISNFGVAPPMTADGCGSKVGRPDESFLRLLPYDLAAAIRRNAVAANDGFVVMTLDRQQVAVDAR